MVGGTLVEAEAEVVEEEMGIVRVLLCGEGSTRRDADGVPTKDADDDDDDDDPSVLMDAGRDDMAVVKA